MIIERSLLCFISILFVVLNIGKVRSLSDDSDSLLEIVHRQEQTLKTLMGGIQKLVNTVEEMQTKIHGQEATIDDLVLKTASQSSEIEALRKLVSGMQGENNTRSLSDGNPTGKFVNKVDYDVKKRSRICKFLFIPRLI